MGIVSFIILGLIAGALAKALWKAASRAVYLARSWSGSSARCSAGLSPRPQGWAASAASSATARG